MVMQQKTKQLVQFEITEQIRESIQKLITKGKLKPEQYLFRSRLYFSEHLSTRQYSRTIKFWVKMIGLDSGVYGTLELNRTKVALFYRRTKNLRAIQLLLEHTKLESTVRYLGAEVYDALDISEQTEV
jgi:hypothetical protein